MKTVKRPLDMTFRHPNEQRPLQQGDEDNSLEFWKRRHQNDIKYMCARFWHPHEHWIAWPILKRAHDRQRKPWIAVDVCGNTSRASILIAIFADHRLVFDIWICAKAQLTSIRYQHHETFPHVDPTFFVSPLTFTRFLEEILPAVIGQQVCQYLFPADQQACLEQILTNDVYMILKK